MKTKGINMNMSSKLPWSSIKSAGIIDSPKSYALGLSGSPTTGGRRGRSNASGTSSVNVSEVLSRGTLIRDLWATMRVARLPLRVPRGTIVLLGKEVGTEVADVPSKKGFSATLESRGPTSGEGCDISRAKRMLRGGVALRSLATDGRSIGLRCNAE